MSTLVQPLGANMTSAVDLSTPVVIGFGVVGRAVARSLLERGHTPTIVEDRPSETTSLEAAQLGVEVIEQPSDAALDRLVGDATVLLPSPGVPDHHRCFAVARGRGVPVRSEFDLARLWDDRPIVAITGTNGKTTVTMTVTDALGRAGIAAAAVGNTDVPLVAAIDDETVEVFVVEASSFRLGHSDRFEPQVATWINFAPDHLDAHASVEAYEAAKASIWAHLGPDAIAIANGDDPTVMAHAPAGVALQRFSMSDRSAEWHLADGALVGPDGPFVEVGELQRAQPHDLANALAVASTAVAAGADLPSVVAAIKAFAGLPHRLELVGSWNDVSWFNDSKATVPQAAEAAVGGFESVVLIAGGKNKGLSLEGLRSTVPPVHHVVAIGDAAAEVQAVFDGLVSVDVAGDMASAVDQAALIARPGDAVLLSPGCTSFDWYSNYAERGLDFSRLVRQRAVGT